MNSSVNLSTIPSSAPPPGLQSNFVDPPNLLDQVIGATVAVQTVTLLFILIRVCDNIYSRQLRPEDYFSYLSWLALISQATLICINTTNGIARHLWDIPVSTLIAGSRRYNYIFICYTISGGFAKATIFMQFKRIFTSPGIRNAVYWAITSSLVMNALAYSTFLFLYIFTCWPREKIWNPSVPGRCMDSNRLNMAIGGLNTLSDIEAFLVPVWAVWKLRIDVKKKISILAVFAVGALAVAIGCLGLYYRVLILQRADKTWLLTQTGIICMAELGIVIVVGCCPYIPRILRRHKTVRQPQFIFGQNCEKVRSNQGFLGKLSLGWSWSTSRGSQWTSGQETNQMWYSEQYARGEDFITRAAVADEP